jgi:hypothetical protein
VLSLPPDQRTTDDLALKAVAGGQQLGDHGVRGWFGFNVGELVSEFVQRLPRRRLQRNETEPADHLPAGVLEEGKLLANAGLAGPLARLMECEYMIQQPHGDLQPFDFVATKLLDFEPKMAFF